MDDLVANLIKYDKVEKKIDEYKNIKTDNQSLEISITAIENKRYVEISLKNLSSDNKKQYKEVFDDKFDDQILPKIAYKYAKEFKTKEHMILPSDDKGFYANVSTSGDCLKLSNLDLKKIEVVRDILKIDEPKIQTPKNIDNNLTKVAEFIFLSLVTLIVGLLVIYMIVYIVNL